MLTKLTHIVSIRTLLVIPPSMIIFTRSVIKLKIIFIFAMIVWFTSPPVLVWPSCPPIWPGPLSGWIWLTSYPSIFRNQWRYKTVGCTIWYGNQGWSRVTATLLTALKCLLPSLLGRVVFQTFFTIESLPTRWTWPLNISYENDNTKCDL